MKSKGTVMTRAVRDRAPSLHLISNVFVKPCHWLETLTPGQAHSTIIFKVSFLWHCFGLENNNQCPSHCFCSPHWTVTKQILIILMTLYITEMLTFKPITQIQWIILVQASEFEMTFPCLRKIDTVPFKSQFVSLDGHRQSVNAI